MSVQQIEGYDTASAPRFDNQAEQVVLGAMLMDTNGAIFDEIVTILGGSHTFYRPQHAQMYDVLVDMRTRGIPVDHVTFTEFVDEDQARRIGGLPYLHTVMAATPTTANGPYYARQVSELALFRALESNAVKTIQRVRRARPGDAQELLDTVQSETGEIALAGGHDLDIPTWAQGLTDTILEMEQIAELAKSKQIPGIRTGLLDVDHLLGGLRGGQLVIVAGRPGIGKSVCGRGFFQYAATEQQAESYLFTLEMSRNECIMAMISAGAEVPLHLIRSGKLSDDDWTKIARYITQYGAAPAYIDDRPGIGLNHARQVLRRRIARGHKPKLLVWDYLQITPIPKSGRNSNREQDIGALTRGFKLLAKEFDIPVVLISQLNRGPEQRADKRPQLSDLRESGNIEQDADVVILLHRDDYYDKESPRAGEADFDVAKHRGGATDVITVVSQLHYQRFKDMAIV